MRDEYALAVAAPVIGVMFVLVAGAPRADVVAGSATAVHLIGRVEILDPGQSEWVQLAQDAHVREGTQVRCGAGASAELTLPDQSSVLVAENSRYVLTRVAPAPRTGPRDTLSHLLVGKVVARVGSVPREPVAPRPSSAFMISTPTGLAVVSGIAVVLAYDPAAARTVLVGLAPSGDGASEAAATYIAFATGTSRAVAAGTFVTHVAGQLPTESAPISMLPPAGQQQLTAAAGNSQTAGSAVLTRESVIIVGPRTIQQILAVWASSLQPASARAGRETSSGARPAGGATGR